MLHQVDLFGKNCTRIAVENSTTERNKKRIFKKELNTYCDI